MNKIQKKRPSFFASHAKNVALRWSKRTTTRRRRRRRRRLFRSFRLASTKTAETRLSVGGRLVGRGECATKY